MSAVRENNSLENDIRSTKKFSSPWVVITLSASFLFYKYILQVSPSIMTSQLMLQFNLNAMGLGNLAATFFYAFLITQFFAGILLDKYNPRLLTALALATCASGAYFFSESQTLTMATISRSLMGVGAAFATVSYIKMASIWFKPKQFAFVCGLLASAAMLGAVFGQAPLSFIVHTIGWRKSLMLCSFLGFILAVLFFALARHQPDGPKVFQDHQPKQTSEFHFSDILDVLKRKQNWLLTFYSGLVFAPIDAFAGLWSIPFLSEAYSLSYTKASLLISFVFIGLGIGSPVLGLLSDYLGRRRNVMFINAIITFIALSFILYYPLLPLWLLATLLFIVGFSTSAFMLGFSLGRESNKLSVTATIVALINTGDVVFSAFTEPLIGKLLDLHWHGVVVGGVRHFSVSNYRLGLTLLPLYIVLALVVLLFIREQQPYVERRRASTQSISTSV